MRLLIKKYTKVLAFMISIILVSLFLFNSFLYGQVKTHAAIYHFHSGHTPFPDTGRAKGHRYNGILYNSADHYQDSTVLVIAPKHLEAKQKVDLVFWFHGWGNHVDSAAQRYELIRQFEEANCNAVLVLPETAKDAPDSYGGKLEHNGEFKLLVNDVLAELKRDKVIGRFCEAGNIVLAGHSGAYRVMAHILQNGQEPVKEVILFDALYAETDSFVHWLGADDRHRFIDIYTDHGGTDDESRKMMALLAAKSYQQTEENNLSADLLRKNRTVFIHSLHEHNDIINRPDNFKLMLQNGILKITQ
jgi:hypothetical protein